MTKPELWDQVDADLYQALHLSLDASMSDVQRSWHRRARTTHPDSGGDEATFRTVHVAYLVLSDPDLRSRYDATRRSAPNDPRVIAPPLTDPDLRVAAAPVNSRLIVGLALILLGSVVLSYAWPGFTIIIGCAVGGFVLTRYVLHWRRRTPTR